MCSFPLGHVEDTVLLKKKEHFNVAINIHDIVKDLIKIICKFHYSIKIPGKIQMNKKQQCSHKPVVI